MEEIRFQIVDVREIHAPQISPKRAITREVLDLLRQYKITITASDNKKQYTLTVTTPDNEKQYTVTVTKPDNGSASAEERYNADDDSFIGGLTVCPGANGPRYYTTGLSFTSEANNKDLVVTGRTELAPK
jgi:predicted carbohydrate-binding protein with CBM5 and CBM33 domain